MKRIVLSSLAALAASLAPLTYAQPAPQPQPEPQREAQPAPQADATQQAPAADPPSQAPTAAAEMPKAPEAGNTRLAALVPAGLTPEDACRGFKGLSDCSAALHVAQNLNIPFADLKQRVTSGQSLTKAIHALKPKADSRREAQRAAEQAREDLRTQG